MVAGRGGLREADDAQIDLVRVDCPSEELLEARCQGPHVSAVLFSPTYFRQELQSLPVI